MATTELVDEDPSTLLERRRFLAGGAALFSLLATGCPQEVERALRRHFKKMSKEEVADFIALVERDTRSATGNAKVRVKGTQAQPGVSYGYGLDLSRCVGCRRCVYACVEENNQSRDPQLQWIRVFELDKGKGVDFEHGDEFYEASIVPRDGKFYMPVACQHCVNPPCVKVCPTEATWAEPDGIVVIDYDWCIGCRYCMAACPYGARHFNWTAPAVDNSKVNPNMHILGNVPRDQGVVEKCTFCIQRVREGRYPACLEVCPVGARKFGNMLDPNSEIRYLLETKQVFVLKPELGTQPRFFYFWG